VSSDRPPTVRSAARFATILAFSVLADGCVFNWNVFRPDDATDRRDVVNGERGDEGTVDVVASDVVDIADTPDTSSDAADILTMDADAGALDVVDAAFDSPDAVDATSDVRPDVPADVVPDVPIIDVPADAPMDIPRDMPDVPVCVPRLVVNEVQHTGAGGAATDEFVEIFNAGTCDVALDGWALKYSASSCPAPSTRWTGVAGDRIVAGGYAVIGGTSYTGPVIGRLSSGIAATGGGIGLYNPTNVRIDSVAFGMPTCALHPLAEGMFAANPPDGQSIARIPNATDTDNNVADFQIRTTPTPGASN